ncbi:flagellar biosynthesis protein FlhA [Tundrisphaera lichenicola]|uniref:flagellar biosynthesis protein FlhA n=1 Tax=Tundrisphaera lichenicola TaxID=2029860 RepID=UPI003EB7EED6
MPPAHDSTDPNSAWSRLVGLVLPVTIIGAILVFIVPVPPAILDLLQVANITLAVLVLLTTLAIRSPTEFSAFPTILLTTTLTRLVLNVATTRLVLTKGHESLDAAGGVVRAFGEFVAGDQVLVGAILFAILVVIQFVVITKGATRISEVAARFMLDGLPGRQMAIDADLHAGLIDQHEAHNRRASVYRQADFFGAMDGAGKFVRGDAVAGVIITLVNIGAGLFLGVVNHGMSPAEAVDVFTKLTIGDGLVSQVPAFLISLSAGLIVTRSSEETDLGGEVTGQLLGRPMVLGSAAAFLGLLAFTPLPKLPLLTLAGTLATSAFVLSTRRSDESERIEEVPEVPAASEPASDRMEDLLHVDPLELEIGYRMIGLADPTRGGDLLDRLRAIRHRVARDLGLIVPQVRIRDEIGLGPHDYRLKIRGAVVGQGMAYAGRLLAVPPAGLGSRPEGRDGFDPVTGQPAVWIHADGREVAVAAGCRVLEASAVVAGHFGEIVLGHADELMTRDQVGRFLDRARATSPALVDEVVPGLLRAGEVQQVLQGLLRERVSVRDQETILETLAVHAARTKDIDILIERVRRGLARRITQQYLSADGRLRVATLARALDARLGVVGGLDDTRPAAALGADVARGLVRAVAHAVAPLIEAGHPPIVLCSAEARPVLKDLTRVDLPRLVVLSQREIPRDTPVETLGIVSEDESPVGTSFTSAAGIQAMAGIGLGES